MTLDELKERQFQKGFTLTELLLAMVIIGVVAALTIPALIANINRKNWISGIKKSYTVMAEGLKQAEALNGKASTWGEENFIENLMSGFKVMKECNGTSCLPNEQFLNGEAFSVGDGTVKSFVLADGSSVVATMLSSECDQSVGSLEGICGTLYVDVDGEKGPNTMGKDFFGFYVTQTGVIPYGSSKIDTVEPGYNWVSKGCHSGDPVCAEGKFFSCSNASGNQTVCNTCGGDWRTYTQGAYSEPVYRTDISSYKIVSYNVAYKAVYRAGHTAHGSACTHHAEYRAAHKTCNGYARGDCRQYSGYTCSSWDYYCTGYTYHPASGGECTSYAYYVSPQLLMHTTLQHQIGRRISTIPTLLRTGISLNVLQHHVMGHQERTVYVSVTSILKNGIVGIMHKVLHTMTLVMHQVLQARKAATSKLTMLWVIVTSMIKVQVVVLGQS